MARHRPIDIIKYPFSHDAAINRSFTAPGIIHSIAEDLLSDHIAAWHDLPPLDTRTSTKKHKNMRNFRAVRDAVTKLGSEIARAHWNGHVTLTLGGGHTQGIATIKASALIYIIKQILTGDIPLRAAKGADPKEKLLKLGNKGDIASLCRTLDALIKQNRVSKKHITDATGNITVIWLDSHPDYNDRHSTVSGNIHGMALAACTGHDIGGIENLFCGQHIRINPANIYVIGARDIDPGERAMMDKDGVHYKNWELTRRGKMRTVTDPDHPITLKIALDKVLKRIGQKKLIFSMDVDSIHAGLHESAYGLESVAATGTPMGLRPRDVRKIFTQTGFSGAFNRANAFIRLNANDESPDGPSAGDVFEAVQGILRRPNLLAADLSEISPAAGEQGRPIAEDERGLTLQTSMRVLAAMVDADLGVFSKALQEKRGTLAKRVREAMNDEKSRAQKK